MASKPQVCAATTWGSPSAPKVAVLIHGLASSSQTWIDVAPELVKEGDYKLHSVPILAYSDDVQVTMLWLPIFWATA
jgi:hypothetical protein